MVLACSFPLCPRFFITLEHGQAGSADGEANLHLEQHLWRFPHTPGTRWKTEKELHASMHLATFCTLMKREKKNKMNQTALCCDCNSEPLVLPPCLLPPPPFSLLPSPHPTPPHPHIEFQPYLSPLQPW